ncbi:MAG TPA: response regulator [Chitinophagales bacterium]|nr:response regulator [Chitinophagales bacterium]
MKQSLDILLIDDDTDDIETFREALDVFGLVYTLAAYRDWESASTVLDDTIDLPDVIVLDLNMPRTHGFEALAFIKANVRLRFIPVIVLSVSRRVEDHEKSTLLGAAGFFSKPQRAEGWHPIVKALIAAVRANEPDKVT